MAMVTLSDAIAKAATSLGYSKLKPEQEQAITYFACGNDVFVALPTEYGKSLCFALLPQVFDLLRGVENQSIAMIVSPLVALMREQVASFSSRGISAACLSDMGDRETNKEMRRAIKRGKFQLVFLSPEALFATLEWRRMLFTDLY